jgi:acetoacetyl-CoA synthetase
MARPNDKASPELLWTPQQANRKSNTTAMDDYRNHVNKSFNLNINDSQGLIRWSNKSPQDFWIDLYRYLKIVPSLPPSIKRAYDGNAPMSSNPPFFEGLEINYAENAMFSNPDPDAIALIGLREGQSLDEAEYVTWQEFRDNVRLTASALRRSGIKKGDRVGALVATSNFAMVLFHATAAIGAIFTCISPDLGLEGCVARLQQVTPSILFVDSDAVYKGKAVSTLEKLDQILARLKPVPATFVVPIVSQSLRYPTTHDFLQRANQDDKLTFTRVSFNDPLMICYSSGTTGPPKCIVHRHGLCIQTRKISILHNSLTPADVVMQYSSTSWVVFYIMCGHFSVGAATICYNGSPLYPDAKQLLRIVEKFKVTYFGSSPRYLLEVEMSKCVPKEEFDLSALKTVYTTGATLSPEQYKWFYRSFPPSIQICNTAGGTDTATSLIALDPTGPIYAGEMQIRALGMDVDIVDSTTGASIYDSGEAGELIIRKPFPSMPCFFWGDEGNRKYKSSYFERFANIDVWAQHDWLSRNPRTGGFTMHGRSDGVLSKSNCATQSPIPCPLAKLTCRLSLSQDPSGIRFGSSEIYAIVESPPFNTLFSNTLCVGRRRPHDTDEAVFLFVVPASKTPTLTPALRAELRASIRANLSARHVPRFIFEVSEVPVTINGKKVEVAVKQIVSGKDVEASATVANPGSLELFKRFRGVEREGGEARL